MVEQFVLVFDPSDAEYGAAHDADHSWIGRAGPFRGFDQLAGVRRLLAVLDVTQAGQGISPFARSAVAPADLICNAKSPSGNMCLI